jgi:hypothetical protein
MHAKSVYMLPGQEFGCGFTHAIGIHRLKRLGLRYRHLGWFDHTVDLATTDHQHACLRTSPVNSTEHVLGHDQILHQGGSWIVPATPNVRMRSQMKHAIWLDLVHYPSDGIPVTQIDRVHGDTGWIMAHLVLA